MGLPMAQALRAEGFDVVGFDIRPAAEFGDFADRMQDLGNFATVETIISVVRDIPQTDALLFDDQRLVERAGNLRTLVISSTVAPSYVRSLRERLPNRVALVDAPMSGAPIAAREARLAFMLGGTTEDIAPLMPLFRAMGKKIHYMGPLAAGMTMKVLNNMIAASSVIATRHALDWAAAAGISQQDALSVFEDSSGQTWVSRNFDRIEWIGEGFDPANTMGILAKDVTSALDAVPPDADTTFPNALIAALKSLTPRE